MKVLVTGGSGLLGSAISLYFKDYFDVIASYATHKVMINKLETIYLDITDAQGTINLIKRIKPDLIVHTAALVGVRECEENKEKAWLTNVEGTQNIVNALKKLNNNCYLIYMSTACVFAGENKKFYTEYDIPAPKNYYSLTKLCGEIVVRQYENACIIRTNFVPKQQWKYPKAFVDRFGTYLFSDNVAKGVYDVYKKKKNGIIHIVGDRRMSMYELALLAGSKNVGKMTLYDYKGPPLTIDMSLSTKRWQKYSIK